MNKWLIAATLVLGSSQAVAGQKINESLEVEKGSKIDIEHMNGRAEIKGWDKDEVKVVGELDDRAEEFIFRKKGSRVVIEVEMPSKKRGWNNNDEGDELMIYVPHESYIDYESINADVEISEIEGGIAIDTVNGNVDAEKLKGRISLESVNGRVVADRLEGDIKLETVNGGIRDNLSVGKDIVYDSVNGNISVKSEMREIRAETVNGGIEMELGDVTSVELTTVNGQIRAKLNLLENGKFESSNVSGRIEVEFQKDIAAIFDVQAHAGGRLDNRITDDRVQKAKYGPHRWLEFSTGSGKAKVEMSTVSGRIVLDTHND